MRSPLITLALLAPMSMAMAQDPGQGEKPDPAPKPALYEGRDAAAWVELLKGADLGQRRKAAYALWSLRTDARDGVDALVLALRDADAYVRSTSAKALLRLSDGARGACIPGVAELLESERQEVRREAVTLLWRLGPLSSEVVPQLTAALESNDAVVRANAAAALLNAGEAALPAIDRLVRVAGTDDDGDARRWAGKAVALLDPKRALTCQYPAARRVAAETWAMPEHRGWERADVRDVLLERVLDQDEDEMVRAAMGHALDTWAAFSGDDRPVEWIGVFRRILEHDRAPAVRAQGAYGLGRFKGHGAVVVPILTNAAASKEPEVRMAAVLALGWLGEEARSAESVIVNALGSKDADMRSGAAVSLAGVGARSEAAITALCAALDDEDRRVRRQCMRTLAAVGAGSGKAENALVAVLADESRAGTEHGNAARALASIGRREATLGALATCFERDPDARSDVAFALVMHDAPQKKAALEHLSHRLRVESAPYTEIDYARRLGAGAAPLTPALVHLLGAEDRSVRLGALGALEAIGPRAAGARESLEALASSDDTEIAIAARAALDGLGEFEPANDE